MKQLFDSPLRLRSERAGWIPTFGDLTYNLAAQYGWVYGLSVTEMEIVHGAFRKCNPNGNYISSLPRINVFFETGLLVKFSSIDQKHVR